MDTTPEPRPEGPMLQYALQMAVEDRDLLPLTGVGAVTQQMAGSGLTMVLSTAERAVFERWCRALRAAGRPYEKLP